MYRFVIPLILLMSGLPAAAACRLPPEAEAARDGVLQAINAIRSDQGLAPLSAERRLEAAAQAHACDSAVRGRMGHASSDGGSLQQRVDAQGYEWRELAENVAFGQRNAAEVVRGWLQSPPHRKNMMMRRGRDAGVGLAVQADGRIHWVLNIAR